MSFRGSCKSGLLGCYSFASSFGASRINYPISGNVFGEPVQPRIVIETQHPLRQGFRLREISWKAWEPGGFNITPELHSPKTYRDYPRLDLLSKSQFRGLGFRGLGFRGLGV